MKPQRDSKAVQAGQCRLCARWLPFLILGSAFLIGVSARAGIPEPDNVLWGSVRIGNTAITAARTDVVVEARRSATGAVLSNYRMGSNPAAGDLYSLRIPVELAPIANAAASEPGSAVYLVLREGATVRDQKSYIVGARGVVTRIDFGNVDNDGNGLWDDWERQFFSNTGQDPNADPDQDGQTNLKELQSGTNPLVADTRHPADNNPTNNFVTISEVTAYGLAWKLGQTWPQAPNPIPIDYVTRAGTLWKGGEKYKLDRAVSTTAPMWWVNVPLTALNSGTDENADGGRRKVKLASGDDSPPPISRALSATLEGYIVTLIIEPSDATSAWAVEEALPSGWSATEISDDGVASNSAIRWGPFFDAEERTLTYRISGNGTVGVTGTASFDGESFSISGTVGPQLVVVSLTAPTLRLKVRGEPSTTYSVEVSTDLASWTVLTEVRTDVDGEAAIEEEAAVEAAQFYRLRK